MSLLTLLRLLPRVDAPADDTLVRQAAAGDQRAFEALYARHARVVHAVLLARLSPEEADDQVQEVFWTALRRLGELRDGMAVGGWLCQVARRRAADVHRARRPTEPVDETSLGTHDAPVAEAQEALAAIRRLPEAYRETLLMRLVEGLTGPEIAERTGLTPGSVRVNLHRGMALLRAELGDT